MPSDTESLKIANDSGFPLQIAVENKVSETTNQHGWSVRYTEHAWSNYSDQQSGFIDLVLQNRDKNIFLVVECKRPRDATWIFMHSNGEAKERQHAKALESSYSNGAMKSLEWKDVTPDPKCPEVIFCAVRGQSVNDNKTTLVERVGAQLVSATEAFAQEEKDYRHPTQSTNRFYFNVIVTTAVLKVAEFNPHDVSLADGTIKDAKITEVPFVRFRKQLSMRPRSLTTGDFHRQVDIANLKENTVFIVHADALLLFLEQFELSNI